jgi:hypothetical protein
MLFDTCKPDVGGMTTFFVVCSLKHDVEVLLVLVVAVAVTEARIRSK